MGKFFDDWTLEQAKPEAVERLARYLDILPVRVKGEDAEHYGHRVRRTVSLWEDLQKLSQRPRKAWEI